MGPETMPVPQANPEKIPVPKAEKNPVPSEKDVLDGLERALAEWEFTDERDKKTIRTLRLDAYRADLGTLYPPNPPGASRELREMSHGTDGILEQAKQLWDILQNTVIAKAPDPRKKELIGKMFEEYRSLQEKYEARRAMEINDIQKTIIERCRVPEYDRDVLSALCEGTQPVEPPEGASEDLKKTYDHLVAELISLHNRIDDVAARNLLPDPNFPRDLHQYSADLQKYEEACTEVYMPTFTKALEKSGTDKDALQLSAHDWKIFFGEVARPVIAPLFKDAQEKDVQASIRKEYEDLRNLQALVLLMLSGVHKNLRKDQEVPHQRYQDLLGAMTLFLLQRQEYEQRIGIIPEKQSEVHRLLHLVFFGAGLHLAQEYWHKIKPAEKITAKKLQSLDTARNVELRQAYEKVRADLLAKGLTEADIPSWSKFWQMETNTLGREFLSGLNFLNPIEYVLFSLILYFSKDKTKAAIEFLGCLLVVATANVSMFALERFCMRQALMGDRMLLKVMQSKVPAAAKFALVIGVLFGLGHVIDTTSAKISDWVDKGPFKSFIDRVLSAIGYVPVGGVVELTEWGYRSAFGVCPEEENASLDYLSTKTGSLNPLSFGSPTLLRNVKDWNNFVDRGISMNGHSALFSLEKIDVPQDGDMKKSAWVKRQAAQTFAQASMLRKEELAFITEIEKIKKQGKNEVFASLDPATIPSPTAFVLDTGVEHDSYVTLDERLVRARDGLFLDKMLVSSTTKNLSAEIRAFQVFVEKCKDPDIQKAWERLLSSAAVLGARVSVYRHLGVYDQDLWGTERKNVLSEKFAPNEYIRDGLLEQVAYRVRLSKLPDEQLRLMMDKLVVNERLSGKEWLNSIIEQYQAGIDLSPSSITGHTSVPPILQELQSLKNISEFFFKHMPAARHSVVFDCLSELKNKEKCTPEDVRIRRAVLQNIIHKFYERSDKVEEKQIVDLPFSPDRKILVLGTYLGELDSREKNTKTDKYVSDHKQIFSKVWKNDEKYQECDLALFEGTGNDGQCHRRMLFVMPSSDRRTWKVHIDMRQHFLHSRGWQIVDTSSETVEYERWAMQYRSLDAKLQSYLREKEDVMLSSEQKERASAERWERQFEEVKREYIKSKSEKSKEERRMEKVTLHYDLYPLISRQWMDNPKFMEFSQKEREKMLAKLREDTDPNKTKDERTVGEWEEFFERQQRLVEGVRRWESISDYQLEAWLNNENLSNDAEKLRADSVRGMIRFKPLKLAELSKKNPALGVILIKRVNEVCRKPAPYLEGYERDLVASLYLAGMLPKDSPALPLAMKGIIDLVPRFDAEGRAVDMRGSKSFSDQKIEVEAETHAKAIIEWRKLLDKGMHTTDSWIFVPQKPVAGIQKEIAQDKNEGLYFREVTLGKEKRIAAMQMTSSGFKVRLYHENADFDALYSDFQSPIDKTSKNASWGFSDSSVSAVIVKDDEKKMFKELMTTPSEGANAIRSDLWRVLHSFPEQSKNYREMLHGKLVTIYTNHSRGNDNPDISEHCRKIFMEKLFSTLEKCNGVGDDAMRVIASELFAKSQDWGLRDAIRSGFKDAHRHDTPSIREHVLKLFKDYL